MVFWYYFLGILGILLFLLIIFGYPRKKNERTPSLEGLEDEAVVNAFERMQNFFPFKLLRRKVIKELKKYAPTGTLVDVGCGSGHLLVQIAEQFPNLHLIGMDLSSTILEKAKKRAVEKNFEKLEFRISNAEELPFSDNSIDFLISTLSLHHWTNPHKILNEFYRVLKPSAVFLIFDFRRDSRKFFYGLFTFATKIVVPKPLKQIQEPLGSIKASYTPEEILQLCSQTPVKTVEIKPFLAWMFISGKKIY